MLKNFRRIDGIHLDVSAVREFLTQLPSELWDPVTGQICFTHTSLAYETKAPLVLEGCGSLIYQWSFEPYDKDKKLKQREVRLLESNFTIFNDQFVGTPIHDVYLQLSKKFEIGRLRLMKLAPKKCLSWHTDTDFRIHFALKTDEACRMVIDDEAMHIPADGLPYICDTRKFHTALNGSHRCERIHLVVSCANGSGAEYFATEQNITV